MRLSVTMRKPEPGPKRVWLTPLQAARMNFQRQLEKTVGADYSKFENSLEPLHQVKDDSDWFRFQVKKRLESGRNIWGGVTGELGSGKTYWAMRVCEEFDPGFSVDRVIFSSKDFIQTVQKLESGSWVLYDEPGVTMSHRAWMSEANRIVTWFLQSSRYRRVNALFCLPALPLMDIAARTILSFQALILDRGIARVYRIRRNQFGSSPAYFTHRLGTVKAGFPSRELVEAYEKRRREWHENFFKEKSPEK